MPDQYENIPDSELALEAELSRLKEENKKLQDHIDILEKSLEKSRSEKTWIKRHIQEAIEALESI